MGSMGGARCAACEFTAKVVVGSDPEGTYHRSLSCPNCRDVILDEAHDGPLLDAEPICPECAGEVEALPDFSGDALCPVCRERRLRVCCLILLD